MSVFAISDLHLSLGSDKPMDKFGAVWERHAERLADEWAGVVREGDTVLIPGDISWADDLESAAADLDFLNRLPGNKLISKGNHDYWWPTAARFRRFCAERGFGSLTALRNAAAAVGNAAVAAIKGAAPPGTPEYESGGGARLYARELGRLRLALERAAAMDMPVVSAEPMERKLAVMLHYPPQGLYPTRGGRADAREDGVGGGFTDIIAEYGADICVYGHLHNVGGAFDAVAGGTRYILVAADHLRFRPLQIY